MYSQASLTTLKTTPCASKTVWDCKQSFKQLASKNGYNVLGARTWRNRKRRNSGHHCKKGVKAPVIGLELYCELTKAHLASEIYEWENIEKEFHWKQVPGQKHAKKCVTFSPKKTKNLLDLTKNELRLVTSHCPVRSHLIKIGKTEVGRVNVWNWCRNSGAYTSTLYLRWSISLKTATFERDDTNALSSNWCRS